jgi:hypothetical protein
LNLHGECVPSAGELVRCRGKRDRQWGMRAARFEAMGARASADTGMETAWITGEEGHDGGELGISWSTVQL